MQRKEQTLHKAAKAGNLARVTELLKDSKTDVNAYNKKKYTPLHCASRAGKLDIVKKLVERGANLNMICSDGDTALDRAIRYDRLDVTIYLASQGAKHNKPIKTPSKRKKNALIKVIFKIDDRAGQIKALEAALDPTTAIGEMLYAKLDRHPTSIKKGSLKEITDKLREVDKNNPHLVIRTALDEYDISDQSWRQIKHLIRKQPSASEQLKLLFMQQKDGANYPIMLAYNADRTNRLKSVINLIDKLLNKKPTLLSEVIRHLKLQTFEYENSIGSWLGYKDNKALLKTYLQFLIKLKDQYNADQQDIKDIVHLCDTYKYSLNHCVKIMKGDVAKELQDLLDKINKSVVTPEETIGIHQMVKPSAPPATQSDLSTHAYLQVGLQQGQYYVPRPPYQTYAAYEPPPSYEEAITTKARQAMSAHGALPPPFNPASLAPEPAYAQQDDVAVTHAAQPKSAAKSAPPASLAWPSVPKDGLPSQIGTFKPVAAAQSQQPAAKEERKAALFG